MEASNPASKATANTHAALWNEIVHGFLHTQIFGSVSCRILFSFHKAITVHQAQGESASKVNIITFVFNQERPKVVSKETV